MMDKNNIGIYPMMPKVHPKKRKELRKFEQMILKKAKEVQHE